MDPAEKARGDLMAMPSTRAIVYTDGDGRVVRAYEKGGLAAAPLGEGLDLLTAALGALGRGRGLGEPRSAVLMFTEALVVVGPLASGERVAVVAGVDANLGLLLSQFRGLLAAT